MHTLKVYFSRRFPEGFEETLSGKVVVFPENGKSLWVQNMEILPELWDASMSQEVCLMIHSEVLCLGLRNLLATYSRSLRTKSFDDLKEYLPRMEFFFVSCLCEIEMIGVDHKGEVFDTPLGFRDHFDET